MAILRRNPSLGTRGTRGHQLASVGVGHLIITISTHVRSVRSVTQCYNLTLSYSESCDI